MELEVPLISSYNYSMMNEKEKGLRGLGGTKIRIEYPALVVACEEMIKEIGTEGGNFNMNTNLFLEGLREDIYDVNAGEECGLVPKSQYYID